MIKSYLGNVQMSSNKLICAERKCTDYRPMASSITPVQLVSYYLYM